MPSLRRSIAALDFELTDVGKPGTHDVGSVLRVPFRSNQIWFPKQRQTHIIFFQVLVPHSQCGTRRAIRCATSREGSLFTYCQGPPAIGANVLWVYLGPQQLVPTSLTICFLGWEGSEPYENRLQNKRHPDSNLSTKTS